jgi:hypothetical protein
MQMKGIRYLFTLLILIGLFSLSSCSKEKSYVSPSDIVGKWMSTAVYFQDNGQYNWVETNSFREFLTFFPDARFDIFTDVPGGTGIYSYNSQLKSIRLQFKDASGGTTAVEERSVEDINNRKLVVAFYQPSGQLINKVEYTRID